MDRRKRAAGERMETSLRRRRRLRARRFARTLALKGVHEWRLYVRGERPELPPLPDADGLGAYLVVNGVATLDARILVVSADDLDPDGPTTWDLLEATTIDPTDGTKRVWLIWAHWCPYCQQELPEISTWYPENADRFPNSELVTVTTSMDPSRGNPLDEYLEAEQFPFPVLVDEDSKLAAQFGTSAFPFWVVTNGDGTVLYRTAGLIGPDAVEQLFTQLEQVET